MWQGIGIIHKALVIFPMRLETNSLKCAVDLFTEHETELFGMIESELQQAPQNRKEHLSCLMLRIGEFYTAIRALCLECSTVQFLESVCLVRKKYEFVVTSCLEAFPSTVSDINFNRKVKFYANAIDNWKNLEALVRFNGK